MSLIVPTDATPTYNLETVVQKTSAAADSTNKSAVESSSLHRIVEAKEGESVKETTIREDYNVYCAELQIDREGSDFEAVIPKLQSFMEYFLQGNSQECSKAMGYDNEKHFETIFGSKDYLMFMIGEGNRLSFNLETYCQATRRNLVHQKDSFANQGIQYFPGDIIFWGKGNGYELGLLYRKRSGKGAGWFVEAFEFSRKK